MASSLRDMLVAIETRLKTIEGLRVTQHVPDAISPPAAFVGVPPIPAYRIAMGRRAYEINFSVTLLVSASLDRVGQLALADYVDVSGPKSIPLAIEGDRAANGSQTLGGLVADVVVLSFRPLGLDEVGVIGYYGGVWDLKCVAKGVSE